LAVAPQFSAGYKAYRRNQGRGRRVKKQMMIGGLAVAAQFLGIAGAGAGPWEDGMASYNRGDYMPAIRLFRPLAERGNAKAQHLIGVMYHRGEGVARNSVRAFAWFTLAAAHGDRDAKAKLREVSKTLTPEELSQARDMAQACEASNYQSCEY
jgi:TPR repeat protein